MVWRSWDTETTTIGNKRILKQTIESVDLNMAKSPDQGYINPLITPSLSLFSLLSISLLFVFSTSSSPLIESLVTTHQSNGDTKLTHLRQLPPCWSKSQLLRAVHADTSRGCPCDSSFSLRVQWERHGPGTWWALDSLAPGNDHTLCDPTHGQLSSCGTTDQPPRPVFHCGVCMGRWGLSGWWVDLGDPKWHSWSVLLWLLHVCLRET